MTNLNIVPTDQGLPENLHANWCDFREQTNEPATPTTSELISFVRTDTPLAHKQDASGCLFRYSDD